MHSTRSRTIGALPTSSAINHWHHEDSSTKGHHMVCAESHQAGSVLPGVGREIQTPGPRGVPVKNVM